MPHKYSTHRRRMILLPLLILTLSGLTIRLALPDQFRNWIEPKTSAAAAVTPRINGKLAFSRSDDNTNDTDIYLMYADGSGQTNITNSTGSDSFPDWSPDGKKIAFVSARNGENGKLYVMNADGSAQTKLTNGTVGDGIPDWSPDSTKIVFPSYNGSVSGIHIINADGTGLRRITSNSDDNSPVWSPGGTKIAFVSYSSTDNSYKIYVINASGGTRTKLTSGSAYDSSPSWSPDGTKIIFSSGQGANRNQQIFVMDANGANPQRLTENLHNDHNPTFSPDGTKILFSRQLQGGSESQICVMNADGTDQTGLTERSLIYFDIYPDWQGLPLNAAGYVQFDAPRYNVIENIGTATLRVTRHGGSTGAITVDYATASGTATEGADYTATQGVLTFADGETTKTISIPILDDGLVEWDETVNVTLSNPTGGSAPGDPISAVLNLIDNSHNPVLSVKSISVLEGNLGSTAAVVRVSLSAATGRVVTANYRTIGVTAKSNVDFQNVGGTLNFNPGETEQTVPVAVIGDKLDEPDETFSFSLSLPANADLPTSRNPSVVTIIDNDPVPTLSVKNVTVTEGNTGTVNAVFTLTLSAASGKTITLSYQDSPRTADWPGDYRSTYGTFSIAPGQRTKSISVPIRGDLLPESTETFVLDFFGENSSQSLAQGVCTILDTDVPPTMSILDAKIVEGNSGTSMMRVTVKLSAPSTEQTGALFKLTSGTARANVDFRPVGGGFSIYPGRTVYYINVPIIGDTLKEADETFFITLSNPQNIKIADGRGVYTIIDNE